MSGDDKIEETVSDETQQPESDQTPEVQPEPNTPDEGVKEEGKAPEPKRRQRRSNAPKDEPREPVLTLGRMVRYVTASETERPAVVTRINEDEETVDLTVFNSQGAVPVTDVERNDDKQPGTYHWPEWV